MSGSLKNSKIITFICLLQLTTLILAGNACAADDVDGHDQVADASEMTEAVEVEDEGMVPVYASDLVDGTYDVVMRSSSSMFRSDHTELRVHDGIMEAVLYMSSSSYLYMYEGSAQKAAEADSSSYITPVMTEDGMQTFTLPVDALDEGESYAAFSRRKEKWYDRTLLFEASSLPESAFSESRYITAADLALIDGDYTAEVELQGGSGRASIQSPAVLHVFDGACSAEIVWSSSNYDFMVVDGEKYDPIRLGDGGSAFEIPVAGFDAPLPVQADTTAMSRPHLIDYTLTFDSSTIVPAA
ncbi:MAG: hypothetical protein Q4G47_08405 [Lachnospiraceae bacterium]|nr:hypothetical protein [Lachnospiraceae bacterium]